MIAKWKPVVLASALLLLGLVLVMTTGGLLGAWLIRQGVVTTDQTILAVMTVVAVLLMLGAMVVGALWMRGIDEAAREAHKAAWYWGGSAGLAIGGALMIIAGTPQAAGLRVAASFHGRTDPTAYMALGAAGLMALMLVGYAVVWAWWWLARSRG